MTIWNKGSSLGIMADSLSTCEYRQGSIWIIGARLGSNLYYAVRQWKNGETVVSVPKLVNPDVGGDVQIFISEKDGYVQLSCGGEFWWIDPKDIDEIQSVYPEDNPKPSGMPDMVIAVLGILYESKNYSDQQLNDFALKCSLAGIDYVRVMGDWESYFTPGRGQSAFKRTVDNRFDLNQPDLEYGRLLKRLQDILKPYHIGIYFDFFDNCENEKGPWAFNMNGVRDIYDPSPQALVYFQAFIDRIIGILGIDHVKYGIGNELSGDHMDWMMAAVLPYAEHMLDKEIKLPLCFSGDDMTAHHLHGLLSPDISHRFGIRDSCNVFHCMGYPADVDLKLAQVSGIRCFGYSDDGVLITNPADQGHCTAGGAYAGNTALKIKTVKQMWEWMKPKSPENIEHRLDHIEFLPREISWGEDPTTIAQDELDVFWQMALEIWGFDIRRKISI